MKLSITLELTSIPQLEALQNAIDIYIDCEGGRDNETDMKPYEKLVLKGAREVQQMLQGKS